MTENFERSESKNESLSAELSAMLKEWRTIYHQAMTYGRIKLPSTEREELKQEASRLFEALINKAAEELLKSGGDKKVMNEIHDNVIFNDEQSFAMSPGHQLEYLMGLAQKVASMRKDEY